MHLWHRAGDNPKAALAKGVEQIEQIAQSVANHMLRQLGELFEIKSDSPTFGAADPVSAG
ncbi:hypothetical protein JYT20_00110 [Rhodothermus sp. AH-315-K08]|nr:hypothetical protein [Rhodothermus sp. AH-315-K08]